MKNKIKVLFLVLLVLSILAVPVFGERKTCGKYSENIDCTCNKNQEKVEVWECVLTCDTTGCYCLGTQVEFKYAYCIK